jgi:hypothetical protein
MVSLAITAVGKTIPLAYKHNPTKILGSDKFRDRIQEVLDGWKRHDPHTTKKLPVEADVPEYIATLSLHRDATEQHEAVGDMVLIAFYYLLQLGEYATIGTRPGSKRTIEYKLEDLTFFGYNNRGQICVIPHDAPEDVIASADSATLKLDNQKNGHKGVCVHQEANGDPFLCPIRALGQCYLHRQKHGATQTTTLSTYFMDTMEH